MASRQAILTDNAVQLVLRKNDQKEWIGYIVISKNFYEGKSPLFSELCFHFPLIKKIQFNNESIEHFQLLFNGREGPFSIARHAHFEKFFPSDPFQITLTDTSGKIFSCEINLNTYTFSKNEFMHFPDELYPT